MTDGFRHRESEEGSTFHHNAGHFRNSGRQGADSHDETQSSKDADKSAVKSVPPHLEAYHHPEPKGQTDRNFTCQTLANQALQRVRMGNGMFFPKWLPTLSLEELEKWKNLILYAQSELREKHPNSNYLYHLTESAALLKARRKEHDESGGNVWEREPYPFDDRSEGGSQIMAFFHLPDGQEQRNGIPIGFFYWALLERIRSVITIRRNKAGADARKKKEASDKLQARKAKEDARKTEKALHDLRAQQDGGLAPVPGEESSSHPDLYEQNTEDDVFDHYLDRNQRDTLVENRKKLKLLMMNENDMHNLSSEDNNRKKRLQKSANADQSGRQLSWEDVCVARIDQVDREITRLQDHARKLAMQERRRGGESHPTKKPRHGPDSGQGPK